jgi:translation initiation factor IF-2
MAKLSVALLAEDLGIRVSQLQQILVELGIVVENASVLLDEDTAQTVRDVVADLGDELKKLHLPTGINARDLAAMLGVIPSQIQKKLMVWGQLVGLTQALKPELAERVVRDYGLEPAWGQPEVKVVVKKPTKLTKPTTKSSKRKAAVTVQERPPIVTILGHVDHGKTTLLDYIRKTGVADREFGGITQHIGAYQAEVNGKRITFLDTPGHEAFTKMRARGAQVTDIAILVVAADDGVMPQTIEAIDHATNAGVEVIVAINKIDKAEANLNRVQQELSERNLVPREWGGPTEMIPVSAKAGTGVDHLLETIILTAELMELRGDANAKLKGSVIEAKLDKGRGPVATILVQEGTLKIGDSISAGTAFGKIKAMFDYKGDRLEKAGPATPAEILGLSEVPSPGDLVEFHPDERSAREIASERVDAQRVEMFLVQPQRASLQDLYQKLIEGEIKDLNVVVKADVGGSVEAVREQLEQMQSEEVVIKVISTGVGNVNESDVDFASAAEAIVVGFNVKIEPGAKALAERQGVEVRSYKIIYELLDDIEKAMKGMLEPKFEEIHLGNAEIRAVFKLTRSGVIAGSYVTDGKIQRNANARLSRAGEVIFTGKIGSLKHLKDDVKEMAAGFECGISLDGFDEYKEGDIIEAYEVRQVS